jgi:hypothetical protein
MGTVQNLSTHAQQLGLCSLQGMNVTEPHYTSRDFRIRHISIWME